MTVAAPTTTRAMLCNRCGGEWKAPAGMPSATIHCPYCNVAVCACGCGADLSSQRAGTRWLTEYHREQLKRSEDAAIPVISPVRTVAEARTIQEDAKGHWSMIVREGICTVLRETGGYHADDLDHLGIPDEHRNIIGSQTAKLVNQKWMEEHGRRKSILPSRNGAKSGIYRITTLGRKSLAGVGAEVTGGADSGENSGVDGKARLSREARGAGSSPLVDAASPEPSIGAEEEQSGEGNAATHESNARGAAAPSTGRSNLAGTPTSSAADSDTLPGLEPSPYERMSDAA